MTKKKSISKSSIISKYMDHVLEHNENPKSIYIFSKNNNFEEQQFYNYFASFDVLEKAIFKAFFDNTLHVLEKSEEYKNFNARNKLLTFYYTFFENLTANRSYIVYALSGSKNSFGSLKKLDQLKAVFSDYILNLGIETLDLKREEFEKIKDRGLKESAWGQLLITLKFWLNDTSPSFEKTDVFIEKSVNASFDLMDVKPIKSIIDLGKFLFKEKANMS